MENYEEKYKKALVWMRSIYPTMRGADKEDAEHYFPELSKSEDEKIRKEIIQSIQDNMCVIHKDKCLAWLEKQKEIETEDFGEFINELSKQFPEVSFAKLSRIAVRIKNWLEKQVEQKPVEQDTEIHDLWVYIREWNEKFGRLPKNEDELAACIDYVMKKQKPADKVEPKFKVSDWITNGEYTWKVTDIKPLDYILQSQNGDTVDDTISYVDEEFHIWTIEDAKDGDVLATKKGNPFIYDKDRYNNGLAYYYAGLDVNKELTLKSPHHMLAHFGELSGVFPATKEQCDLLFSKMKEAGYEWDIEKKELKNIEQTSTWSEEDEERIEFLIAMCDDEQAECVNNSTMYRECTETKDWLKSLKDRVQPQLRQEWSKEDEKMFDKLYEILYIYGYSSHPEIDLSSNEAINLIYWLKSLKPQNHWKPSEEQMEALKKRTHGLHTSSETRKALESLIDDLKTL